MDSAMRMQGKIAFVTGAGQGIGRAVAVRLAQEGAKVVINDLHDDSRSEQTLADVRAAGSDGCIVAGDVSVTEASRQLIAQAVQQMGRIDVLVNNAGVEHNASFLDVTEADYDRVLDINLKGTFNTLREAGKRLRDELN